MITEALHLLSQPLDQEFKIRETVVNLLDNKDQIRDFMEYPKHRKQDKLKAYKNEVQNKIKAATAKEKPTSISKAQRKIIEKKILSETQIICTTLGMSVNEKLEHLPPNTIEYLIVDEACQAVELLTLIPFEHRPQRIILVGD